MKNEKSVHLGAKEKHAILVHIEKLTNKNYENFVHESELKDADLYLSKLDNGNWY